MRGVTVIRDNRRRVIFVIRKRTQHMVTLIIASKKRTISACGNTGRRVGDGQLIPIRRPLRTQLTTCSYRYYATELYGRP
jgi:hypothetical protein